METRSLLASLSNAFGVSGFEDDVRRVIEGVVAPWADDLRTDVLGNLLVTRRGRTKAGRTVMLDAHMDEIGFLITHIESDGFLRFTTVGGWDTRLLLSHAVTIRTRSGALVRGVVGTLPPHILSGDERERPVPLDALYLDIGASSADEAAARGIRIGDPATIAYPCEHLSDDLVMGKALDDRAGCAVLIKTLEALAGAGGGFDGTLVCAFTIGEETGLRGARTAANQIEPDVALAIEGTVAADLPGVSAPKRVTGLGRGPAITIADRTMVVRPQLVQALERVAEAEGLPYQIKRPAYGGTDAGVIHTSGRGVLAGSVSVPCRYIHSPFSVLRVSDFEATVRLVTAFVREVPRLFE
jgi:tetrahedral aminopeptidase